MEASGALTEGEPVLRGEPRNGGQVELESEAGGDHTHLDGIGWRPLCGQEVAELLEVAFETGGRDELQHASRFGACVPEGVPLAPGLEDQVARCTEHDLIAEHDADRTCEHEGV